jgi:uncharacterized protein YbbC (DUF1343 family)
LVHGVEIHFTDDRKASLSLIQFYLLQEARKLWPGKDPFEGAKSRFEMFDKVCGTDRVRLEFTKSYSVDAILDLWTKEIPAFRKKAEKYFLY